jgi:hypothetical protein
MNEVYIHEEVPNENNQNTINSLTNRHVSSLSSSGSVHV